MSVDLEVTERQPSRYGLGPVEWTCIFIGITVATSLITNLTNDVYTKAKQLLLDRRTKGRQRDMGFVIYGPDSADMMRFGWYVLDVTRFKRSGTLAKSRSGPFSATGPTRRARWSRWRLWSVPNSSSRWTRWLRCLTEPMDCYNSL